MVKIGEVFWVASVSGVDSAVDDADELEGSMNSVASTATQAAEAQNEYADSAADAGDETERAGFLSGKLDVATGLLGSTLFFTAQRFGLAGTAATAYAGAVTVAGVASGAATKAIGLLGTVAGGITTALAWISGLGSSFLAWLAAGSAGALAFAGAIGFGLGVLGVWILQVTGALDAVRNFGAWVGNVLPGWVRDGLLQMLSLAVGPLAAFGGFITGFLEGGFDEGFRRAGQVINVFIGAWDRQIGRIVSVAEDGWNMLKQGWTDFKNWIFGIVDGIVDRIMAIPDAAAEAADAIPGSDLAGEAGRQAGGAVNWAAGGLGDLASGEVNIPTIQSGGMINEGGLAQVHRGEAVIPRPIVEAARGGRGGGGGTKRVEEGDVTYDVTVGDQSLDLSRVDRSTLRELARMIGNELGNNTGNLSGGK